MRAIFPVFLLLGVGLGACQFLVGIGSREEAPLAPTVDAAREAAPTNASVADASVADASVAPEVDGGCGLGLSRCGTECVDLRSDSKNCGECGHDCLGAQCKSRECVPELVTASSRGGVALVTGGDLIYRVADDDTPTALLRAHALDGGAERDLFGIGRYAGMAPLGGTRWLLFDNPGTARIRIVDLAAGVVERTIYEDPAGIAIRAVANRGNDVFFATRRAVRHVRLDGTGLGVVRSIDPVREGAFGAAPALDVTDTLVYFGIEDSETLHELTREPKPDSRLIDRGSARGASAGFIHVDPSTNVLTWLTGPEVRELPLDGGAPYAYPSTLSSVHSTARAGSLLFVSSLSSAASTLVRIDLSTRRVFMLGSGLKPTGQIALDDRYVYLPAFGGGTYRVAR